MPIEILPVHIVAIAEMLGHLEVRLVLGEYDEVELLRMGLITLSGPKSSTAALASLFPWLETPSCVPTTCRSPLFPSPCHGT